MQDFTQTPLKIKFKSAIKRAIRGLFFRLLLAVVPPLVGLYVFVYTIIAIVTYFEKPLTEKNRQELAGWVKGAKERTERLNRYSANKPSPTPKKKPADPSAEPSPQEKPS